MDSACRQRGAPPRGRGPDCRRYLARNAESYRAQVKAIPMSESTHIGFAVFTAAHLVLVAVQRVRRWHVVGHVVGEVAGALVEVVTAGSARSKSFLLLRIGCLVRFAEPVRVAPARLHMLVRART